MYKTPFYIENPLGNNAFSYEQKTNKKLFVPSLKKIHSLQEIKLGNQIVFEDFDFDDVLISATGLKNFYEMDFLYKGKIKKCYLFDNHNHAFFFWFLAKKEKIITENGNILLHIDAHSDMRIPVNILSSNNKNDLEKIFHYTNFELNVGNYIFPAKELGLIQDIIQIRDNKSLEKNYNANILNLDLDFFAPELNYIEYNKKKEFILRHLENVNFLTVASSPFFINQTLAIQVFQDIFKNIQIV